MDQLLVLLTLPPYLLQKLQDKAGCLHVETASSSQPVNWGWIDLFSTIHVLDRVVSCNNQIDQTSWLMWIMGSSASLLFPAVSTTYLIITGFKINSSIHTKLILGNKLLFDDHSPKSVFLPGKLDCCRQGAGCGQNCSQLENNLLQLNCWRAHLCMYHLILTRVRAGGGRWHAGPSYRGASCQAGHGHSYNVLIHSTLKKNEIS